MLTKFTSAVTLNDNGSLLKKSGTRLWTVKTPFVWYLAYIKDISIKAGRVTVPEGFDTDFGSIPRIFWYFFNPTEWVAYILHDYLYDTQGFFIDEKSVEIHLSRASVDRVMREALIAEGCGNVSAWLQWLAVRMGGWVAWRKN